MRVSECFIRKMVSGQMCTHKPIWKHQNIKLTLHSHTLNVTQEQKSVTNILSQLGLFSSDNISFVFFYNRVHLLLLIMTYTQQVYLKFEILSHTS